MFSNSFILAIEFKKHFPFLFIELFNFMTKIKPLFYLLFCFFISNEVSAQKTDSIVKKDIPFQHITYTPITAPTINYNALLQNIKIDSIVIPQKTIAHYPPLTRDYKRLGYNTGVYVGVAIISFAILWVMPESVSGWDKVDIKENGLTKKWKENVNAGPVLDEDNWILNYVTHPYSGAVYFMTARSSGFTFMESFAYSAIMSTFFWEYGIEAFAEVPSIQDLIITPVIGSVMGEGFFYAKKSIMKNDKRILKSKTLGVTALILMDPFNTFIDALGYEQEVKTEMNITPIGYGNGSNKSALGVSFSVQF